VPAHEIGLLGFVVAELADGTRNSRSTGTRVDLDAFLALAP
jgi:hypothetical protein